MDQIIDNYVKPKYIKTSADLEKYIQLGSTTESIYMDFKLGIEISSVPQKKKKNIAEELALDICQYANSWGGVLLIGIKEAESKVDGKKVAQEFTGITNFEELAQFINDSVFPLINPKEVKIDLVSLDTSSHMQIVAINVFPLAIGVACVCNISPPYSQKYPYRTHYGKKYLHPIEVEKRMSNNNRSVPIKLEDLWSETREVTLFPQIEREPIDRPDKWDTQGANVLLKKISDYQFSLDISGIDINIPFSLVKDVWFTEKGTIGILLSTRLTIASNRKSIYLGL